MTKRDPHADNDMIDKLQEEGGVADSGASGGNLQRDVGAQAELNAATGGMDRERPHASDHPQGMNEAKGDKTRARLQPGQDND